MKNNIRSFSPTSESQNTSIVKKIKPSISTPEEIKSNPVEIKSKPKPKRRKRKGKEKPLSSNEESIRFSIQELLGIQVNEQEEKEEEEEVHWDRSGWNLEKGNILEVKIHSIGSFGDGLAISPNQNWILIVPFTVPNDVVKVKVYRNDRFHSFADLISILSPGEWREEALIKCEYFGKCSGCQYQMIRYEKQLELKQIVIEKAFQHFSGLDASLIPKILPTLPSPLQYEYRTKLTPHFELPRKKPIGMEDGSNELRIGFAEKGRKRVIDIEECMIATSVINEKLTLERNRVRSTLDRFKRGATLLLRDSLIPISKPERKEIKTQREDRMGNLKESLTEDLHVCITDHQEIIREKVQDRHFEQNAGSFFQNNSSILNSFLTYLISLLNELKASNHHHHHHHQEEEEEEEAHYLVDTYCGSGLFSICLADQFTKSMGIEVSSDSIKWAKHNAILNGIENVEFLVGQAESIFKDLTFPSIKTTVIIDPPRKGCDESFLHQLLSFKPRLIFYISCNVHTQARDIGQLAKVYKIQSIRGADFFPQSHHCESIVCLSLIE
ncbi:S-adenosyl-L-methionine-dependent methyltransferase [Melampsora americana]|nr:S-adenosyl-L-methionine-dependent methyltransferase [Melampsora americana]